jgi:protein phosphatase
VGQRHGASVSATVVKFLPVGPEDAKVWGRPPRWPCLRSSHRLSPWTSRSPTCRLWSSIGPSGSGSPRLPRKHFLPTEVLSSDFCRGLVSDDENDQKATTDAFEVLHFIARKRLAAGKLTVVDATNVQPEARKPLVELARDYHCMPVAIVFNLAREGLSGTGTKGRPDFGPTSSASRRSQLRRSLRGLQREGFRHVFVLETEEDVEAATVKRVPLWNDRTAEHGPFDIIGDVHGCCDELEALLDEAGLQGHQDQPPIDPVWGGKVYGHPEGRKAVFLGDIVDRGPRILDACGSSGTWSRPAPHTACPAIMT